MKWFKLHNEISKGWLRLHIFISILIAISSIFLLSNGDPELIHILLGPIYTLVIYYILLLSIVWIIRGFKEGDS